MRALAEVHGSWISVSVPLDDTEEAAVRRQLRELATACGFPDAEIWRGSPPDAWPELIRPVPAAGAEAWGWIATKEVIDAIR